MKIKNKIFHLVVWVLFIFSAWVFLVNLIDLFTLGGLSSDEWTALLISSVFLFLIGIINKNKLVLFGKWAWQKENLYKIAIIIIVISLLIIALK